MTTLRRRDGQQVADRLTSNTVRTVIVLALLWSCVLLGAGSLINALIWR